MIRIGQKYVLLVDRYDREEKSGRWSRLHQEDFCQALATSNNKKYEQEGGPRLSACARLIEERSVDVAGDIDSLLKWQMLNVLTGNCDGHGKNLSLLRQADGNWRLAPFYDLVDTRFYPNLSHRLAMSVGGQFDSGAIAQEHWKKEFSDSGVSPTAYLATFRRLTDQLPDVFDQVVKLYKENYGESVFLKELRHHQMKIIRRNLRLLTPKLK